MNRTQPTTPNEKAREALTLAGEAITIVLIGLVLGVAFNFVGLAGRPPNGLPWITSTESLGSVDSLLRAAEIPAEAQAPRPSAGGPAASREATHRTEPRPHVDRTERETGSPPATPAMEVPPEPAANAGSEGATASPSGSLAPRTSIPVIPDAGRPLGVEFPTVVRLVEAGAALVVDARDNDAYAAGHIPGAVNVPYEDALRDPTRAEKLDSRGRPIIVYCSGGTCEASRMLAAMLTRDFKRRRVLVYEAGFPEWAAAGKPVAKGSE